MGMSVCRAFTMSPKGRNCGFEGAVLSRTFSKVLFCQKFDELVVQFT